MAMDQRATGRTFTALVALGGVVALAACSKEEPQSARPNTAEAPAAAAAAPAPASGEIDAKLRERLARQEAAAKLFDKAPEPPKPAARAEAPKVAEAPRPEPPKPEPPRPAAPEPRKAEPPKPEPVRAEPPKPEAPKAAAAAPQPSAEPKAPPPAPRTEVAAAKPGAAPAPAAIRVLARVEPEFPREALRTGTEQGSVRARLTLDAAGGVKNVEVVESYPRRVFDRAVINALSQWKFNAGAADRTYEAEIQFRR
jgi:protein TonB